VRIVASPETAARVRDRGGLLFVWPCTSRRPRLVLTILVASLDPPPSALDFRRFEDDVFTLFLHPSIHSLPDELWVEFRGHRLAHVCAYWNVSRSLREVIADAIRGRSLRYAVLSRSPTGSTLSLTRRMASYAGDGRFG
jgi:hypothetical protein